MPIQPDPDQSLAGYRLVRKLGEGHRAQVFLGIADSDSAARRSVALKVYRSEISDDDINDELSALAAVDLAHCVRLVDVASDSDGRPVPILDRVGRGSVIQLLRDRDAIDAGEAVTLLAPIAQTMSALHRRGVAHGNLALSSIHLGAGGEPIILGWGHSSSFSTGLAPAALDAVNEVREDRDALADVACILLQHVRSSANTARLRELQAWIDSTTGERRFEFAGELEDRLFNLADPRPVVFAAARGIR
jgi:serine/threonine protein kinase